MEVLRAAEIHVAAIARLRMALLEETGGALPEPARQQMQQSNEAFFRSHLQSPLWQDWVAVDAGQVCGTGALAFLVRPPYPGNPEGLDAYLLNMYTVPACRGRGAARGILDAALTEAQARGVRKIVLHATEAGRRLYVKRGFEASGAYMELALAAT